MMDDLFTRMAQLDIPTIVKTEPESSTNTGTYKPHMKLEVPKFDGQDAMGWIFKINQFFEYQGTTEADRIKVASFYMEGPTLSWYQWMHSNGLITSWNGFLQALETHFAPSYYEDPRGVLFKLTQKGTVNYYLNEFERLANRIVGLPVTFLLSCFVSGLNPEIRREVQAMQPISLTQAVALAKLQEEKLHDLRKQYKGRSYSGVTPSATPPPHRNLPPLLPTPPRTSYKKLTHEEMLARHEKGFCYNCDKKFHLEHKCKGRFFLLVAETEEDDIPWEEQIAAAEVDGETGEITGSTEAQISFNALTGLPAPEALKMMGLISKKTCYSVSGWR
jgi:hypothetical protein